MKLIWMTQSVDFSSQRTAIVTEDRCYTYEELNHAVLNMIQTLRESAVRTGQRVVIIPDHNEVAIVFMAAASAIGLQFIMPYNLLDAAHKEWKEIIENSKPDHVIFLKPDAALFPELKLWCKSLIIANKLIISPPQKDELIVDAPDPVKDFMVLFTSGTTGNPKAISISESLICARIASVSNVLRFHPSARIFLSGLMNNTTGIIFSFGSILREATLFIPRKRLPEHWPSLVNGWKITHLMLRPLALRRFINEVEQSEMNLKAMEIMAYGAAALPRSLLERARELIPCDWIQGYGLSETFGPFCWLNEDDHKLGRHVHHVYSVGKPDNTLEVAISAESGVGEVIVRGKKMMEGYLDFASGHVEPPPEWFHTGDYGEFTEDGMLVLKGRVSNSLLSKNGHRVYPEEVERILADIPGVDASMVVHIPGNGDLGNSLIACIHGSVVSLEDEVIRHTISESLTANLSREKWPNYIYPSQEPFPKSENDKFIQAKVKNMIESHKLIALLLDE